MRKPSPRTKCFSQSYQELMKDQRAGIQTLVIKGLLQIFRTQFKRLSHAMVLGRTESPFTSHIGFMLHQFRNALWLPCSFMSANALMKSRLWARVWSEEPVWLMFHNRHPDVGWPCCEDGTLLGHLCKCACMVQRGSWPEHRADACSQGGWDKDMAPALQIKDRLLNTLL